MIYYPYVFDTMPTAWYQKCTKKETLFPMYYLDLWRGNRSRRVGLSGAMMRWENLSIEKRLFYGKYLCVYA